MNIFENCDEYTFDPFLKEIIVECSKGKFPKGIIFNSQRNTLRCSLGVFEIPQDKLEQTNLLIKLFKIVGIKSPHDIKLEKENFDTLSLDLPNLDCEWKKIKPRNHRDVLLLDYVCKMGTILGLNKRERRCFYNTINLGLFVKLLDNSDIEYYNREIKHISNISFDSKTRIFKFENINIGSQKTYRQSRKTLFRQKLNKYIKKTKEERSFKLPKVIENVPSS